MVVVSGGCAHDDYFKSHGCVVRGVESREVPRKSPAENMKTSKERGKDITLCR